MESSGNGGVPDQELAEWTLCDEPPYDDVGQIAPRQVTEVLGALVAHENDDVDYSHYQAQVAVTMAADTGFIESVPVMLKATESPEANTRLAAVSAIKEFLKAGAGLRDVESTGSHDGAVERIWDRAILENGLMSKVIQIRDGDPVDYVRDYSAAFIEKLHQR